MDWLTWSTEVVRALAWPLVVLILGFTFKEQLSTLIHRVTSVKGFGTEASFRDVVSSVESAVDAIEDANEDGQTGDAPAIDPPRTELLDGDPDATVLAAWSRLELAVRRLTNTALPSEGLRFIVPSALKALSKSGVVDPLFVNSVMASRDLRNRIVVGHASISAEEALRYQEQTERLRRIAINMTDLVGAARTGLATTEAD